MIKHCVCGEAFEDCYVHRCPKCGAGYLNPELGSSKITGVGPDAETVTNEQGGKQSKVLYAFDALDPKAMFAMCKVLHEGRQKYGDDENWRKISAREHINHAIIHFMAYLAGDTSDEHLSHAMCRAMMATAVDMNDTKDKAHS